MIPSSKENKIEEKIEPNQTNIIFLQDSTPSNSNETKCFSCDYVFGEKKNKIAYNPMVALLKNEINFQIVCPNCLTIIPDNDILKVYTWKEFHNRSKNETN